MLVLVPTDSDDQDLALAGRVDTHYGWYGHLVSLVIVDDRKVRTIGGRILIASLERTPLLGVVFAICSDA